jgi:iron complex transport system substrate-binding protein
MKKTQRIISCLMIAILCFFVTACGNKNVETSKQNSSTAKYPVTIKDSYDRSITIDKEPERVISVSPVITEIIFALDKGDKLVGRTDYCDYPSEASKVQSIGSLTDPNIEQMVALKPDIVIASAHFKEEVLKKLESLNIKVVVLYGPEEFEGAYSTITNIAKVLNADSKGTEVVDKMKAKVADITAKVASVKEKPSAYYVVGYGQGGDFTAGSDTFISKMINMSGATNAAEDVKGWNYSIEKLVQKDPNIIICPNTFKGDNGLINSPGYKDLTAVKQNKVVYIDENLINRQGPRLADGLEALTKAIHPEIFK